MYILQTFYVLELKIVEKSTYANNFIHCGK